MLSQYTIAALLRNYQGMLRRIAEIENITKAIGHAPGGEIFFFPDELLNVLNLPAKTPEIFKLRKVIFLIDKMILSLDDKSSSVLKCLYIDGNTYDKTSEILEISRATVASRRQKAIELMSKMV